MHFTTTGHEHGAKMTKLAVVGLIHIALGYGVIHSIGTREISLPKLDIPIEVTMVPVVPPKPPEAPPVSTPKVAPPISIPQPEVVLPPIESDPIVAEVVTDPAPADPGPSTPAVASDSATGAMRTAVLAEGCATPAYPSRAVRNGDEGTVRLALLVGASGKVEGSRVTRSSGSRDLDRAALNALSMCRFQPAIENGQPQAGWAQVEYVWRLED